MSLNKPTIGRVDDTQVFSTPLEGDDVVVRIGTIPDGSCFFHAIMNATSKEYCRMNEKGRKKMVQRMRKNIAKKVDRNRWESISNGLVAKIPFQENVNEILNDVYRVVIHEKKALTKMGQKVVRSIPENTMVAINAVLSLTNIDDLERNVLPECFSDDDDSTINDYKAKFISVCGKYIFDKWKVAARKLDKKKFDYCIKKTLQLLEEIVEYAESRAYKDYVRNLSDSTSFVDMYTVGYISDKINRDIYFVNGNTRLPYQIGDQNHIKGRKAIVLAWIENCHYDLLCRCTPSRKIIKQFEPEDVLIKRIHTYLYHPEKVATEFPDMLKYMDEKYHPKKESSRKEVDRSDSDSDESESYTRSYTETESTSYESD